MTIPVLVEQHNGKYSASVLGSPQLRASGDTKDQASEALRAVLLPQVVTGVLTFLDIEPKGVTALAGKYKDDLGWKETWDDVAAEAYRHRDELKAQEFPE
jgi:hypothetical protein